MWGNMWRLKVKFCTFLLFLITNTESTKKNYNGHVVLKLTPHSEAGVEYLHALRQHDETLDFWVPPSIPGKVAEVMVPPHRIANFENDLNINGITFQTGISNVQQAIEEESGPDTGAPFRAHYYDQSASFRLDKYHDYREIEGYMHRVQQENPEIVRLRSMKIKSKGNTQKITHEGRSMWLLKIGKPLSKTEGRKPAIWIDAGIHAREWIAPATALYFIHRLTSDYKNEDVVTRDLLEKIDFYILPVMNPDGYQYSRTNDRMWRKNRRPGRTSGWGRRCRGVDLNRNFDWHWSRVGSSWNKCAEDYHGTGPFSEPESEAVLDFISQHNETIKSFITMHSFGQIWMYPFGFRKRTYPKDRRVMIEVADKCVSALKSRYGTVYEIGTGADLLCKRLLLTLATCRKSPLLFLDSAAGGSDDWAKGAANIKFTYLLELPPISNGNGFLLRESDIRPTGIETWEGIRTLAQEMVRRYPIEKAVKVAPTSPEVEAKVDETESRIRTTTKPAEILTTKPPTIATTVPVCEDKHARCQWYIGGWFGRSRCRNSRMQDLCRKSCKLC